MYANKALFYLLSLCRRIVTKCRRAALHAIFDTPRAFTRRLTAAAAVQTMGSGVADDDDGVTALAESNLRKREVLCSAAGRLSCTVQCATQAMILTRFSLSGVRCWPWGDVRRYGPTARHGRAACWISMICLPTAVMIMRQSAVGKV
jgi:hypothetical protein